MDRFIPAPLTPTGRPVFVEEEVEIKNQEEVAVLLQDNKKVVDNLLPPGYIVLTNIRLITILEEKHAADRGGRGWCLELKEILSIEDCSTWYGTSTRLRICFKNSPLELGLKFYKNRVDEFMPIFQNVLAKRSWEKIAASSTIFGFDSRPSPSSATGSVSSPVAAAIGSSAVAASNVTKSEVASKSTFSVSNAGVSGIIRRQEKSMQSVDRIKQSSLADLESLVTTARDVVKVIERYAAYSAEKDQARRDQRESVGSDGSQISETSSEVAERNEMESIMQSIGIVSPVTKFSAGRQYHQQLARQTADLLLYQGRLERLGGMITLPDLYCLLNRARGTELVSPNDLLLAAELTGKLALGMSLRVFPSGVKVLQLDSFSESDVERRVLELLRSSEIYSTDGIQATELSQALGISITVAKEQLVIAEVKGAVCRDDSVRGLAFFENRFEEFCRSSSA